MQQKKFYKKHKKNIKCELKCLKIYFNNIILLNYVKIKNYVLTLRFFYNSLHHFRCIFIYFII